MTADASAETKAQLRAARLAAVEWVENLRRAPSRAALLSEHLRRVALWAQATDAEELWPWFDIAAEVDPACRADPALVRCVRDDITRRGGSPMERQLAEYSLHFAALLDSRFDLPDPYEPLIALWERGGRFRREVGLVYFGVLGMRVGPLRDRLSTVPVAGIDPLEMDAADAEWAKGFERLSAPSESSDDPDWTDFPDLAWSWEGGTRPV